MRCLPLTGCTALRGLVEGGAGGAGQRQRLGVRVAGPDALVVLSVVVGVDDPPLAQAAERAGPRRVDLVVLGAGRHVGVGRGVILAHEVHAAVLVVRLVLADLLGVAGHRGADRLLRAKSHICNSG